MNMLSSEAIDLLRVSRRVTRCREHRTLGTARLTPHFAPPMTTVNLINDEAGDLGAFEGLRDLLLGVPPGTDHRVVS